MKIDETFINQIKQKRNNQNELIVFLMELVSECQLRADDIVELSLKENPTLLYREEIEEIACKCWPENYLILAKAYYYKKKYDQATYYIGRLSKEQCENLYTKEPKLYENFKNLYSHQKKTDEISILEKKEKAYKKGIVFTKDFSLVYGSNRNPEKECPVPDSMVDENQLTIHQRLAIYESLVEHDREYEGESEEAKYYLRISSRNSTTYLVANIGCIITDSLWQEGGSHKRKFITHPIFTSEPYYKLNKSGAHAEEAFWDYIRSPENLREEFKKLFSANNITDYEHGKIYSIVFDFHGSQDMCDSCESMFFRLQDKGGELYELMRCVLLGGKLEAYVNELKKQITIPGLVARLPTKNIDNFKIIIRYSSSHPPTSPNYRKPIESRQSSSLFARRITYDFPFDIRNSESPLILHADESDPDIMDNKKPNTKMV